jgi:glycosyltransferase involved in cell wall biosynthesis
MDGPSAKLRGAMSDTPPEPPALRVAVTLEQCWHRVPGGTATAALGSVRALQRYQPQLDLVGVSAHHRAFPAAPYLPTVPVRQLPLPRLALYESWHRLRRPAVQRATGPVDLVHVTGMAMPPPTAPLVVTVNDLVFVHEPELFTPRGVSFFRLAIELTRRDADLVLCPSQDAADDCVANGFDAAKIRIVPYGIELATTGEDEVARVRRRFGIDGRYVMWLGTIEPRKNLATLLQAFEQVDSDAVLVLAGPSGWNTDLAGFIGRLGRRVRPIGFVSDDDKSALYAGAAVFCLPSRREGFGLPVLEAMAQATPVVVTQGTSMAEIVGDAADTDTEAGILVDSTDAAALAAALQELLDDEPKRTRLGAGARRRAATFSWARTAGLLADAYAEVAR